MNPINILLVDDSQIHLEGLKMMFLDQTEMTVVGEAHNKTEVLHQMPLLNPDLVLLDIFLEDENDGIDLAAYITSNFPQTKVVMLSHNKDRDSIIQSIQSGAAAYIAKDTSIDFLVKTIHSVMNGDGLFLGETIPHDILCQCLSNSIKVPQPQVSKKTKPRLSDRETEVLILLSKGYTSREIGRQLYIDPSTVETHKEHIKAKFKLKTIIEIVVYSIKNDILLI